jgi:uncharacterized protein (TIGR03435 family)
MPTNARSAAVVIALLALPAAAQAQSADARPAFEAATIKPASPDAIRNRIMPTAPNRLYIPSMSLVWLVYTAYGEGGFNTAMRVSGGPDWANRTAFAVEAVTPGPATGRQLRLMLQRLLEERFALRVRSESRIVDMNVLVVERAGTLGPRIKPWDGSCKRGMPSEEDDPAQPRCFSGYRPGGISLDGATMFSVAEVLSLPQARGLLGGLTGDHTGLEGRYTLELDFPFAPRPADPADVAGPSLSTAIREQWGMRLVPGQAPFRAVVIESAQLPAAN